MDPLADSAYSWSPYRYAFNNPIRFIDPNGKDEWEINQKGQVVNRIENKNEDSFHTVDGKGNRLEGQSISFKYGTITAERHPTVKVKDSQTGEVVDQKLTTFEVSGDKNATSLFKFFADPTNTAVEWSHAKIGTESSGKNIVGTSNERSSTAVGGYLRETGYTLRGVDHNHPSGVAVPSSADRTGAELYHQRNSNTTLRIYTFPDDNYVEYDQNGLKQ